MHSRAVGVAGDDCYSAAARSKATKESENQGCVSEMVNLEGCFVAVLGSFNATDQVPMVGNTNDAAERWEFAIFYLRGDGSCEVVYG